MEAGSIGQLTTMRVMDRPKLNNYILIWQIFPRLWKGVGEGGCWMM